MSEETMTDLTPALAKEQWAHRNYVVPGRARFEFGDHDVTVSSDNWDTDSTHSEPADLHALVAIANHALPADSPHKITWADVERLRDGASHMTEEGWRGDDEQSFVRALAAKLAALLAPR